MGVPEGGILSPLLFNLYLEEALIGQLELQNALNQDRIRAYADDLLIVADTKEEITKQI